MQITIEDLSPVEKRVEFELPWSDVVPKLEKAYDSLRRGVRLPGFRPGKVPRALIEKMYKRQVEDEVARDLVEHSIGQAIRENQIQPVAPPTVEDAGDQVGRAVQVHGARRGAVAGHAQGLLGRAAVAPAGEGDGRGGRGGAGGLPPPADGVQAGRGPHRDRRHRSGAGRAVRPGGGPQAQAPPGRGRPRERRRGRAARPGEPPAPASRSAASRSRSITRCRARGCCPSCPASRCTST